MRKPGQINKELILALLFPILFHIGAFAQDKTSDRGLLLAPLPNLLVSEDGSAINSASQWEDLRREELLELFRNHVYGRVPETNLSISQEVKFVDREALDGTAVKKEVELLVSNGTDSLDISVLIFLPKGQSGPVPLFVGLNFHGNHTICHDPQITVKENWVINSNAIGVTENSADERFRGARAARWPVELLLSRGYGLASLCCADIDPDFDDGFKNGIHGLTEKGDAERPENSWGSIGAWAWGLSRVMDYFEKDPEIDAERVAVIGHSRLGKTSLWAGAQDERFALVISNNSGCGGAALSRRAYGERVSRINSAFPHWFAGKFKDYNDNEAELPVDQHMLLALIAPRPLYVASAEEDDWADQHGEYLSLFNGSPVFELYGSPPLEDDQLPEVDQPVQKGSLGYHIRTGKHDLTRYDWEQYLDFADEQMPACNTPEKPNVVFILVDDLGWSDLGCYGSTFYDTPNLDKLAEQSIRFTNAYSASPVCSPTRAAIMTGKHPVRVGITDWIPGMSEERADHPLLTTPEDIHNLPLEEFTLAELFRDHGYRTFFAGKWHLGESEEYWPLSQGFEINKGGNHKGQPTFPGGKGYYSPYGNPCLPDGPPGEYLTDRLTDESIRFIDSSGEDPFFLYLSFYTVHTPIQGCLEYDDYYLGKSLALPDSGRMTVREEHEGVTRTTQSDPKYAAMVRSMDGNVGRLLKKLEDSGKAENTIVVFTSDNGGLSTLRNGGPTSVLPLRAGKGWCYEGGIRVPLLVSFPGIQHPGSTSDQAAISMDFYPTLRELAGLEKASDSPMDGRSLVPYCREPDLEEERNLVWHYPHYHGSSWRPGSALRSAQWKLIEFYENQDIELYDLSVDMAESKNLRDLHPGLADSLKQEMHLILDEMGAAYPERRIVRE